MTIDLSAQALAGEVGVQPNSSAEDNGASREHTDAAQPTSPVSDQPRAWQIGKNGREFIRLPGVSGWAAMVWRKGDESIEEAIARKLKGPSDPPPRSRTRRKLEERPPVVISDEHKGAVTKQIEEMVADVLCVPSVPCATFGMQWEAEHFDRQGRRFAENIARSSERNPWLRGKLEKALAGEHTAIAWLTSINLLTGALGYFAPPLIKWGLVPAPDVTKIMFGVPMANVVNTPPQPQYQPPPVTDMMENVTAAWARAEQQREQQETPAYPPGDGSTTDDRVPNAPNVGVS